jgi:hypothetical protein
MGLGTARTAIRAEKVSKNTSKNCVRNQLKPNMLEKARLVFTPHSDLADPVYTDLRIALLSDQGYHLTHACVIEEGFYEIWQRRGADQITCGECGEPCRNIGDTDPPKLSYLVPNKYLDLLEATLKDPGFGAKLFDYAKSR